MKAVVLLVFACFVAIIFALDCKHSRSNVRGEGNDIPMQSETCTNENETYCVYVSGNDKVDGKSVSFSYRGCYSDFEKMNEHYHDPGCPNGGNILHGDVSGKMTCCQGNLCNPASTNQISFVLFVLSISALFYVFSW